MAGPFDNPTGHHPPSEFPKFFPLLQTNSHKNNLLDVWFSRPQTTASSLPLSNQMPPQHSSSI